LWCASKGRGGDSVQENREQLPSPEISSFASFWSLAR
jgi:hypothetical protein